jgi:ribonuclease BN (tRNA processing enzyme)
MQVKIWGCRGSIAAPGPETLHYGGNTSCVEVRVGSGDPLIILDAGTGIQRLGVSLERDPPSAVHLLLSHLHLDHLLGLGFFSALWRAEMELHIWGPPSPVESVKDRIARYLSPPLFPVNIYEIPAQPIFHDVPDEPWEIGEARLMAEPVTHRGPTVGYRIEGDGKVLAYIPDHEPALGTDLRSTEPEWISGHSIAFGADILLHDSQYTDDEYVRRIGWGHSSVRHVVEFARIARAKRLVMFHHDPLHSDDDLNRMVLQARQLWGEDGSGPMLAYDDMSFEVGRLVTA